jgi:predicted patatin/cPLA2 family phospholipase
MALLMAAALAGCGPLRQRAPVPQPLVEKVAVPGYEGTRYWGDSADSGLERSFLTSWEQERADLKLPPGEQQFPPARYLAISGGGQNGAFGAGLLCGWTAAGNRPEFKVVTGISTGALLAPFAFLGPAYDKQLKEVYTSVNMDDIAVFAGIGSLIRGDSAYDTAPLSKLAEKYFDQDLVDAVAAEHARGRRLLVGTTNLDAGRPVVWDVGAIAATGRADRVKLFRQVVLASAAIPGAFPPTYIKVRGPDGRNYDEMHVDGGVTRQLFLMPSQLRLFELRDKVGVKRESILYVIRNAHLEPTYDTVNPRLGAIAQRSISALIESQSVGDLYRIYRESQQDDMSFHLAAIPPEFVDDSKTMFDKEYMNRLFQRGYDLATKTPGGYPWYTVPPFLAPAAAVPATLPAPRATMPATPEAVPTSQPSTAPSN